MLDVVKLLDQTIYIITRKNEHEIIKPRGGNEFMHYKARGIMHCFHIFGGLGAPNKFTLLYFSNPILGTFFGHISNRVVQSFFLLVQGG